MEGLTPGRMVHYVRDHDSPEHLAAVVAGVVDAGKGVVHLHVFAADGRSAYGAMHVLYCEEAVPGTWHWIERA